MYKNDTRTHKEKRTPSSPRPESHHHLDVVVVESSVGIPPHKICFVESKSDNSVYITIILLLLLYR